MYQHSLYIRAHQYPDGTNEFAQISMLVYPEAPIFIESDTFGSVPICTSTESGIPSPSVSRATFPESIVPGPFIGLAVSLQDLRVSVGESRNVQPLREFQ